MPRLKTHNEFVNEMSLKHPDIIVLGNYKNCSTKLKVKHSCGYIWDASPTYLSMGGGCPKCNHSIKKTQEEFVEEMNGVNNKILIIGKYKNNETKIKCKCLIDNHEWDALPSNLLRGSGCPVCSKSCVKIGINDLNTTRPDISRLLLNYEDGYKYSQNSHVRINFKCPDCGEIINSTIKNVSVNGLSCPVCGDGISFPNKFARAFLKQLDVSNLIFEYSPKWSNKLRYDNYFECNNNKYILEMDGSFHYKDNSMSHNSIENAMRIDSIKNEMAKSHGINIIRIDSRISSALYLKNEIEKSILNNIFDLSIIDWVKCEEYASNNMVKEICLYYEKHKRNTNAKELSKIFQLHYCTINKYIRIGKNVGWIKDDIDNSLLKSYQYFNPKSIAIKVVDLNNNTECYYKSKNLCIKSFIHEKGIHMTSRILDKCLNTHSDYNGYVFEFA